MSTNKLQKFAERLKARRNRVGFSVERLAVMAGISERTLWGYEKGSNTPDGETLVKICEALTCDIGWLFGEDAPVAPVESDPQDEFVGLRVQLDELKQSDPQAFKTAKHVIDSLHAQATVRPALTVELSRKDKAKLTPEQQARVLDAARAGTVAAARLAQKPRAASTAGKKVVPMLPARQDSDDPQSPPAQAPAKRASG